MDFLLSRTWIIAETRQGAEETINFKCTHMVELFLVLVVQYPFLTLQTKPSQWEQWHVKLLDSMLK